jgi:hypothetical protein
MVALRDPEELASVVADGSPFDLGDPSAYGRWRTAKLAQRARSADELIVDVADPMAPTPGERAALQWRCARWNMAVYRAPRSAAGKEVPLALARQLGLHRLDANWLADEDGVSSLRVCARDGASAAAEAGGFIPYTDRPIQWHTDGYYHPQQRRIRAMVLHCVRPAAHGGVNALLDHELAYIALRDASPQAVQALMAPDAMTIPARCDAADGVARPAQTGPVFAVDARDGTLHMRYTARTRSIEWKDDAATPQAAALLRGLLFGANPHVLRLRLEAGMGLVANNVLHDRSAFIDDPAQPRLLYRARFLDRISGT